MDPGDLQQGKHAGDIRRRDKFVQVCRPQVGDVPEVVLRVTVLLIPVLADDCSGFFKQFSPCHLIPPFMRLSANSISTPQNKKLLNSMSILPPYKYFRAEYSAPIRLRMRPDKDVHASIRDAPVFHRVDLSVD